MISIGISETTTLKKTSIVSENLVGSNHVAQMTNERSKNGLQSLIEDRIEEKFEIK